MSLSTSLSTALSSLATTAEQTSVISRNVANTNNPAASRKSAQLVTIPGYGVRLATVNRVVDTALYNNLLGATSSAAGQDAIVAALDRLERTVGDTELDASPAALLQKFSDAIQK